ncbi:chemotaxis protein CheW [Thiolapillus brandeum]|uniref:Chemosensory pili system protein ChpC n=1 Tax=Thiolapillus brandeum TaxID=1076588 RepID=A0A7U6GKS0_9GAMM|nr:chemotaxis protein CheW [Thiolapillus brandeum]BAO45491.1 chemosensory pili system protein ChpC [Thiolapillus brandeum]
MANVQLHMDDDLQGLLIPQRQTPLLLPVSTVIEILGYREIEDADQDAGWLLGNFSWRNLTLPLISMERLLGVAREETRGRKRIIVVHVFSDRLKMPFLGIEATGMPRMVKLNEENLVVIEDDPWPGDWPVSYKVKVQETEALIPDLDRLGELVADL